MKHAKKAIATLLVLLCSGCLAVNMVGLSPGHEKGVDAAGRILEAALLSDAIASQGRNFSVVSLLADIIAGIDPDAYYETAKVDECVENVKVYGLFLGGGLSVAVFCNLEADGILISDEEFPVKF